jgi:hypothetical protein
VPNTMGDIVTLALREIGVVSMADAPDGDEMALGLLLASELLDAWSGDERTEYASLFFTGTLTPGLQIHTIGVSTNTPAPTFNTPTNRPQRIIAANLQLTTVSPVVNVPMNIRDDTWWMNELVQKLSTAIPTDLFYSPDWPNGSLYFWPVPNFAYGVQLEFPAPFAQITQTTAFSLPPSYQQAFRLTLSETMVGPFTVPMPQSLPGRALEARIRCHAPNSMPPKMQSDMHYAPGGSHRTQWSFYTGTYLR